MTRRDVADGVAAVVAVVVGAAGVLVMTGDSEILAPTSTTSVTKSAVPARPATQKKTTVVTRTRGKPPVRTVTVEVQPRTPAQPETVTTTDETGQRTFLERVLGDVGLVVLQIGVILLAAFRSAALVQRVIVGEYGGLELGSFKLAEVASGATDGLNELKDDLKKLRDEAVTITALEQVEDARRADTASIKDDLALVYKRMDLIERQLP